MGESRMDHKKVIQEILASEDFPLLMHIEAELTILKIIVIKLFKPIYVDILIYQLSLYFSTTVYLDLIIWIFIDVIFQIFHSPLVRICVMLGAMFDLLVVQS